MRFHADAYDLAARSGLLMRPEVQERVEHLPHWLLEWQAPGGRAALEQALGVTVPESLAELWSLPALLCLLDAWKELAYVSHALLTGPELWTYGGTDYLEFAMEGHSGQSWVVETVGSDDPPVRTGFLDPEPTEIVDEHFSAFILSQVQEGQRMGRSLYGHTCWHTYHVRLVPLPGGPPEDLVGIDASPGQSVRDRAAELYPGREVLGIRRQARSI